MFGEPNGQPKGIDLVLDNGNTVAVRGASKGNEAIPLVQVMIENLIATHVIIATNVWEDKPAFYILNKSDAVRISDPQYYKKSGNNSWFIRYNDYRYYNDNHNILE